MLRSSPKSGWLLLAALTALPGISLGQTVPPALRRADAAYRAGQSALAQRDLAAAQSDFEQVIQLVPRMEQGHSALGAVLLSRGQAKQAVHELETALSLQKTDSIAQTNLAMAYQQAGESAKAIPLFEALEVAARARNQALPSAVLAAFARSLAATGDSRQALSKMEAAVQAEPRDGDLRDQLGSLYAQESAWPAAQQEFIKAVELEPGLATAHLHLGLAMQAQGQDGSAELTRAAQLAPENPVIALELGKSYAAAGQEQQAIDEFQQVLDRQPGSAEAMLQMASALQRQDKFQEAFDLLRKVVAMEPKNVSALIDLGMAFSQRQDAKDAVPVLQRSIALAPGNAVAHEDLAATYIQLSQMESAVNELHAALKLSPDSAQIHYDLGLALKLQDQPAAAIPEFERAETLDPAAPEAPFALGQLYLQAARYTDAARELKKSLDLRPQNADGWATLGSVYSNLNMLPEAAAALREATRQYPNQPDAYLTLAAVLIKQNQPAEAIQERQKAAALIRANMNEQRAEVATHTGDGLLKSGDLTGAAERYRDALSFNPNYREAHLGLAKVLDAQGKTLEAAAERKQAEETQKAANP